MAKAQAPAQVGDRVGVLKDDDQYRNIGDIVAINPDETLVVKFANSANEYDYSPDEVVLIPATHILD